MSLALLCEKHTVTVKSQTTTKTSGGAAQKVWTQNPRTVKCNQQGLSAAEITSFAIRAGRRAWKLFTATDPEIGGTEHVYLLPFPSADSVECSVIQPSRPEVLGMGGTMAFVTVVEEFQPFTVS